MHARHRLIIESHIVDLARFVGVDSNPMHLSTASDLFLANDGNIVLGLTRDRARTAADARAKIDNHSPGIAAVLELGGFVERLVSFGFFFRPRDTLWVGDKLRERSGPQKVAPFQFMMSLRRGEGMFLAGFADGQP